MSSYMPLNGKTFTTAEWKERWQREHREHNFAFSTKSHPICNVTTVATTESGLLFDVVIDSKVVGWLEEKQANVSDGRGGMDVESRWIGQASEWPWHGQPPEIQGEDRFEVVAKVAACRVLDLVLDGEMWMPEAPEPIALQSVSQTEWLVLRGDAVVGTVWKREAGRFVGALQADADAYAWPEDAGRGWRGRSRDEVVALVLGVSDLTIDLIDGREAAEMLP